MLPYVCPTSALYELGSTLVALAHDCLTEVRTRASQPQPQALPICVPIGDPRPLLSVKVIAPSSELPETTMNHHLTIAAKLPSREHLTPNGHVSPRSARPTVVGQPHKIGQSFRVDAPILTCLYSAGNGRRRRFRPVQHAKLRPGEPGRATRQHSGIKRILMRRKTGSTSG